MAGLRSTPYEILGVPANIFHRKLRTIYRLKIHEHLQKKISPIQFRCICRAFETLSDGEKRKRYDWKKVWVSEIPIAEYTPQQLATEPDLIQELKRRLRHAKLTEIDARDSITGHTALYCAARAGNLEGVKFLTHIGAEPDLLQRTKSTALHVASFYGHADVVRCLLESGADYRVLNNYNSTPEEEAYNDDVKRVFTELRQNAYVRVAANELEWIVKNGLTQHQDTEYFSQRQTLLHCASKKGYDGLVRWLVEQYSANIDLVDFNGNSALHLAAYGGHTTIVDYFLNRGCDFTLQNRWGTTAEEEGSRHGHHLLALFQRMRDRNMFEMARQGVDWWFYYYFSDKSKDSIDSSGISLLYYACCFGRYSVARWLLENGANVNIQNTEGWKSTPLHVAKFRGHLPIVELLLEYRADMNIKNDRGTTVFDQEVSNEVPTDIRSEIQKLLSQYEDNFKSAKLIDIHIYKDHTDDQSPVAKVQLGLRAGLKELLKEISAQTEEEYTFFSVARRPLDFGIQDESTVISAVYRARYAQSIFIDTPIHLIGHKTPAPSSIFGVDPYFNIRGLDQMLSERASFTLNAPLIQKHTIELKNLVFTFSQNSLKNDLQFRVAAHFYSDKEQFGLSGLICIFKIDLLSKLDNIVELPTVSICNDQNARLYTLAIPTQYWLTSDIRRTHLPVFDGVHAFVRHIDIIPGHLSLPSDMFLAAALDQPLISRNDPVPCRSLIIRPRDGSFPNVAYHGTNIKAIRSILTDGLVVPGTMVSAGIRVNPPSNHFARDETYFDVDNFAVAIFLSPSIHYSSDLTYAIPFSHGDQQVIPVLECSVKTGSYEKYPNTVQRYTFHPGDDRNALEWRIKDPANVQINAILFITMVDSLAASRAARFAKSS